MKAPIQPLSRTIRVTLWWVLVAVFIIGAPLLIGYSQGYRLDDALSLVQTGGIYIHSDMSNTAIYLNGTFVKENGTLLKNTLIQNLQPNKTYDIRVEKEGYQNWVKKLPVQPNLVTEAAVLMLPEDFEWTIVEASTTISMDDGVVSTTTSASSTEVANPRFAELTEYFSEDSDQFAVDVATTSFITVRGKRVATTTVVHELRFPKWLEWVASSSDLYTKKSVRERDGIVAWLSDGNLYATWARKNDAPPYYFCNATCTPLLVIDWQNAIRSFDFYPNRNDVVIVETGYGVYAVELDGRSERNIQPIFEGVEQDFRLLQNGTLTVFDGTVYRETNW